MRSAARKSARPSPTSAEMTPTSVTRRKIVSLRDHLRPDQHVDLTVREARQHVGHHAAPADGVPVEPRDAGRRERLPHLGLDAFGAEPGLVEERPAARRARARHALRVIAVVAHRLPAAVHDERDRAVRALQRAAALAAEHRRREPAPVEQQQHLLRPLEPGADGVAERPAENLVSAGRRQLVAHVDRAHLGHRPVQHAALEREQVVSPARRMRVRLHRRRRRPEHNQRLACCARTMATSRPWYRGLSSCLYDPSCSSSTTMSPMFASGAKTAERVPTTASTSPRRMRCHWS